MVYGASKDLPPRSYPVVAGRPRAWKKVHPIPRPFCVLPRPVASYTYNSVQVTFITATITSTSTHPHISMLTMASSTTPQWGASKFSFDVPDQATEWKKFYTRAIDFLEALDIDPDKEDESKWGWCAIKIMFQDEDRQALQTPLENNIITPWRPAHPFPCPQCDTDFNKRRGTLLVLQRWTFKWLQTATKWRHAHTQH